MNMVPLPTAQAFQHLFDNSESPLLLLKLLAKHVCIAVFLRLFARGVYGVFRIWPDIMESIPQRRGLQQQYLEQLRRPSTVRLELRVPGRVWYLSCRIG